jgi:predicted Fe-Mo cluster-binding NifX family protein
MQVTPRLLKNVKPEPIAGKEQKIQMVKENVGLGIIVHRIHQSHYQLIQDFFLKVLVMRKKSLVELVLTRMNTVLLNVSIAQREVNVQISK